MDRRATGIVLVTVGIIGFLAFPLYASLAWNNPATAYGPGIPWNPGMMGQWSQQRQTASSTPITVDQAEAIAQRYLVSLQNPNLAIKEIMEFQNNFYVVYYEKDTGIGAFETLIWKQAPSSGMMGGGMMGHGMMTGVIMPEPGPNMMWNTKYSMMRGMMGSRSQMSTSSQMPVSEQDARSVAETYLSKNFAGAEGEGITRFYGYYTVDFEQNGKIVGMLSVNGYSGDVWYHSWHGYFIQEKELS